jgi:hypothetical protein
MARRYTLIAILLLTAVSACERHEEGNGIEADSTEEIERTLNMPGTLTSPSGDTVSLAPGCAALVYYWLPLNLYDEIEGDLVLLASLDSRDETLGMRVVPLPVQPDGESRNHAQRVVNGFGVSLPVYLADSIFMSTLDCSILPCAALLVPGEDPRVETGFGGPGRLLGIEATDEPEPSDTLSQSSPDSLLEAGPLGEPETDGALTDDSLNTSDSAGVSSQSTD